MKKVFRYSEVRLNRSKSDAWQQKESIISALEKIPVRWQQRPQRRTKAEDMEYQLLTESNLYVNEKVAENLGITVPDSMNDRAVETFSEISEG